MGNLNFIIVGLVVGVGIAFLVAQISNEAGYATCLIILLILLALGGEFLPIIKKVPEIDPALDEEEEL